MKLVRELRFYQTPASEGERHSCNSWSGTGEPSTDQSVAGHNSTGHYLSLRAEIEGEVDSQTGYICNIKLMDRILTDRVVGQLLASHSSTIGQLGVSLQDRFRHAAQQAPPGTQLSSLSLSLSPYLRIRVSDTISREDHAVVELTQSFEFSASHRLCCSHLSDEQNFEIFGKCANPHGHGHNYMLEVTVTGTPDEQTGSLISVARLDRVVSAEVIERFDHKNLNEDCEEFQSQNPSVENIAKVIYERLEGKLAPSSLSSVRVWETPKTYAEYSGR